MTTLQFGDRIWTWTRESEPEVAKGQVSLSWSCQKGSDYWRLTNSGTIAHNGHACLTPVEGDFSLRALFCADLKSQYDQIGLIAIKSPTEWFKGGLELDGRIHVGGVHTRDTSDWSLAPGETPAQLLLSRKSGTLQLFWRVGEGDWSLIRQLTLDGPVETGFYSAAPIGPGFRATVSGLDLTGPE